MGLLPSQEYDFILESFIKYLIENCTTVGYKREDVNQMWIDSFLEAADKGEWEI